jgi:hypothetical protein
MSEFGTPDIHPGLKKVAKIGIVAGTIAGIGMGANVAQEAEKGPHSEPEGIKQGGIIEIIPHPVGKKPLNFRDRSWIPARDLASNIIPQNEVNLPNGQTAATVDHFYVSTYLLEEGFNPTRNDNNPSKGVWLVFPEADGSMTRMSLSPETSDYWNVIVEGKTKNGHLDEQGNFVEDKGKTIDQLEVSSVSLDPPTADKPAQP